jgi:hypothetical protein
MLRDYRYPFTFCEAEQRFLLLFLEKEENGNLNCFLGASPQTPWVRFADSQFYDGT